MDCCEICKAVAGSAGRLEGNNASVISTTAGNVLSNAQATDNPTLSRNRPFKTMPASIRPSESCWTTSYRFVAASIRWSSARGLELQIGFQRRTQLLGSFVPLLALLGNEREVVMRPGKFRLQADCLFRVRRAPALAG